MGRYLELARNAVAELEAPVGASVTSAPPTAPTSRSPQSRVVPGRIADAASTPNLITSAGGLQSLIGSLDGSPTLALDLETCGEGGNKGGVDAALDPRRGRIRLLALASECGCWVVDCARVDPRPLFPTLAAKTVIGHNLGFDLAFLQQLGFAPGRVDDTMLLSQLVHAGVLAAQTRGFFSLAASAERELGLTLSKDLQKSDWSGDLTREQVEYAARDVMALFPLYRRLRQKVMDAGLAAAAEIEGRCLPAIVWLRTAGVAFDAAAWEKLTVDTEAELRVLKNELNRLASADREAPAGGWNWDSPQQVRKALGAAGYDLPDTQDETLAGCDHPLATTLRRYRATKKLVSSYGQNWLAHTQDGRLYPQWRQIGAASGRMACSNPNVQQVPRDPRYRSCIIAPPGRLLVKADYSQIELRIAAAIAREERMLKVYEQGEDIHILTARQVLGKDEVTQNDRQLAKAINFGLLYGMGSRGFRIYAQAQYRIELSDDEARRYRAGFFQTYPGLERWHRRVKSRRAAETRTLSGRRRLLTRDTPDTQRLNTGVQGTGADGLKRALALLWERRGECAGAVPVLACHDEIVVECGVDQAKAAKAWLRQAMLDGMEPLIRPVPVEGEVAVSRTWAG